MTYWCLAKPVNPPYELLALGWPGGARIESKTYLKRALTSGRRAAFLSGSGLHVEHAKATYQGRVDGKKIGVRSDLTHYQRHQSGAYTASDGADRG